MLNSKIGVEDTHVVDHFILDADVLCFEELLKWLLFLTV